MKSMALVGTAVVLLMEKGKTLESDEEVVEEFNNYFSSVFSQDNYYY